MLILAIVWIVLIIVVILMWVNSFLYFLPVREINRCVKCDTYIGEEHTLCDKCFFDIKW